MQQAKSRITSFQTPVKEDKSKKDEDLWLPDNLSGKILDLEFQCETESLSKQLIDQLIECYSKAIQFYNERGNYKYKIYQKRMQIFLSKPKIEEIFKGRSAKIIFAQQNTQIELKNAENNTKKTIQKLIFQSQKTTLQAYQKLKLDLKKQEDKLEERIRRKRTMSNKSTKTAQNYQDDEFGRRKLDEKMNIKLLLDGINQRHKKVFF